MTDVEIADKSTWEHRWYGWRCVVLGSNNYKVSFRDERDGESKEWLRSLFLAAFRLAR